MFVKYGIISAKLWYELFSPKGHYLSIYKSYIKEKLSKLNSLMHMFNMSTVCRQFFLINSAKAEVAVD